MSEADIDILARTLYGESEVDNIKDATAIASVVMNRVYYRNWPDSVKAVCLQPWQFSCWNKNDPNRERILNAAGEWFETCKDIAAKAIHGELRDPTRKSTHYYATYVRKPKWAKEKQPVYEVQHRGRHSHLFFNNIDTPPPKNAAEALEQERPLGSTSTIKAARVATVASVGVGGAAEIIDQISPAIPLMQTLAEYAPWVLVAILATALAYMVYRRIDDRNKGYR